MGIIITCNFYVREKECKEYKPIGQHVNTCMYRKDTQCRNETIREKTIKEAMEEIER